MNLISTNAIKVLGCIFIFLIIWLSFALSDYLLFNYLSFINRRDEISISNARKIEQERIELEDEHQISEAQKIGLNSLIYPDLFDKEPWLDIAKKYSIAPLAPQPNTSLYYCNEGYGQVRYKSDRYGFRNDDHLWNMNSIDAIIIGDSYVQGACVDEKNTISGNLLDKKLTALNLGTGSNSPIHYAAIAQTFTRLKKIKNLIIVFYPNDNIQGEEGSIYNQIYFKSNIDYFDSGISGSKNLVLNEKLIGLYKEAENLIILERSKKTLPSPQIKSPMAEANSPALGNEFLHGALYLKTSRMVVKNLFSKPELPYGSKLAIDVTKTQCLIWGCKPIFVYIPNSNFWRPDASAKVYRSSLEDYIRNSGLLFIDTTESLGKIGENAYAIKGPHLSPDGYKIVSESILNAINYSRN